MCLMPNTFTLGHGGPGTAGHPRKREITVTKQGGDGGREGLKGGGGESVPERGEKWWGVQELSGSRGLGGTQRETVGRKKKNATVGGRCPGEN